MKMKLDILPLIKNNSIEDIEIGLVAKFVKDNRIKVKNNNLIKGILAKKNNATVQKIIQKLDYQNSHIDLYDLVNCFELLIPKTDRSLNGAFFTPNVITKAIVKEIIDSPKLSICDPSCGCGAFLLETAIFLKKKFGIEIAKSLKNNLSGVDIADYSIKRANILLSLLALSYGEDLKEYDFNLRVSDSLSLDWEKSFPDVFNKGGFDRVLGNPPYVKYQDLPNKLRKTLYYNWSTLKKGNYNLYFAFFELGMQILKNTGKLGYITPNNYFTSLSGVTLRRFLANNRYPTKVIDFNHIKIFDSRTYTALIFLDKKSKEKFLFERVFKVERINNLTQKDFSFVNFKDLNNKKWRLLRHNDQNNIKIIENAGRKLGELFDIRVGIATLKDKVYFIEGNSGKNGYLTKICEGKKFKIETRITKPVVKISDFKNQQGLDNNTRRMIFPYVKNNGAVSLLEEGIFKEQYPGAYKYLLVAKERLQTRDKGKAIYPNWYAYARTQGLDFYGKKLLTPTFSKNPRFLFEKNPNSLFCNGYAIFEKNHQDQLFDNDCISLETLQKILNSIVMHYYITKTSVSIEGGYPCYQKNFIELLGIPNFTDKELRFLKETGSKSKIDNFLIQKYGIALEN